MSQFEPKMFTNGIDGKITDMYANDCSLGNTAVDYGISSLGFLNFYSRTYLLLGECLLHSFK